MQQLQIAIKASAGLTYRDRFLAMRMLILGMEYDLVAETFGKSKDTLRGWIKRFNRAGIDGLIDKPRSGRPASITPERGKQYSKLIEHPELARQTHWTGKKFHGYISRELGDEVGYSTLLYSFSKVFQEWSKFFDF